MTAALVGLDFYTKQALLELVARGTPLVKACELVGTNRRAVNAMLLNDPEFKEDLDEARDMMVARVDHVVYDGAVDGRADMIGYFYKLHRPEIMQTQGSRQAQAGAPAIAVAQMAVQIVQAIMSSDGAPAWLTALHGPPQVVYEATVRDDDVDDGD